MIIACAPNAENDLAGLFWDIAGKEPTRCHRAAAADAEPEQAEGREARWAGDAIAQRPGHRGAYEWRQREHRAGPPGRSGRA